MNREIGSLVRRMLAVMLPIVLLAPGAAQGAQPRVRMLDGSRVAPLPADRPLTVPGRAPVLGIGSGRLAVSSSLRVSNVDDSGTRTNGKIVGLDPREGAYSCSGTALNTPSRSIVLTAGHCVISRQSLGKRISFVPAYDHGKRPFGTFYVRTVFVMPQWRHGENPDFDVAALRVSPNQFGRLTDVVGARGYAVNRSRLSAFQVFGYPAAALGGNSLRSCRAHGLGSDALTNRFAGPPTMPVSCDMAAGSSGGAWIIDGQYVDGVTSYSYAGRPTQLFSSYFGSEVGSFLRELP